MVGERCCWVCCTAVSTASDLRPSLELLSQPSPVDHVETAPDERKCTLYSHCFSADAAYRVVFAFCAVMTAYCLSSSSRMRVIYQNWSATKQRPHPHSVAEISRHSVLSGDRIRQCETSSGSRHKDTDQCKSPFPSAGTAVSLFHAKTVQQRPLLPREVETWLLR